MPSETPSASGSVTTAGTAETAAVAPADPVSIVDTILARMAVPEYPNVYGIGVGATRLTFLSQQHRALNLVWALSVKNRIAAGAKVAVVGGGLAGVTSAAAAHLLGAEVTLLERQAEILHLQRGTQLRFVQPNIYDWPDTDSENPFTDLPFFNWGAGMAATIVETILRQWGRIAGPVNERLSHDVREIRVLPDGKISIRAEGPVTVRTGGVAPAASVVASTDSSSGVYQDVFDLVILAVGFGLERTLASVPFLSYWENDNLGRTVIVGPLPRRYLVSGCGDGGLIDAMRLRIRDFDHARFVYELLSFEGVAAIKARLRDIDREAARLTLTDSDRARIESGADAPRKLKRALADRQSASLWEKYEHLFAPESTRLRDTLAQKLRSDTVVYLNSPTPSPLTLNSSILNRVAVFLLFQYGGLRYRAGEVVVLPTSTPEHVRVAFHREGYPTEELEVHEVVVRHGPRSAIERLLPKRIVEQFVPISAVDDITRARQYPTGFLASTTLAEMRRQVFMDYAAANFPRALTALLRARSGSSLSLKVTNEGVAFVVTDEGAALSSRPAAFDRIPIEYRALARPRLVAVRATPAKASARRVVYCGVGIAPASYWRRPGAARPIPGTGTLGCFVRLASGEAGLLTAASALMYTAQIGEELVQPGSGSKTFARIVQLNLPMVSPPGANLTNGTAILNQFEAAVATLVPGVKALNEFDPVLRLPPIRRVAKPILGEKVLKVGLRSGITYGRISEVEVSIAIQGWGGACWFTNLVAVETFSPTSPPFSAAGDSGALIVRAHDGAALGLLIGGSEHATLASPIGPILEFFNCSLLAHRPAKPRRAKRTAPAT